MRPTPMNAADTRSLAPFMLPVNRDVVNAAPAPVRKFLRLESFVIAIPFGPGGMLGFQHRAHRAWYQTVGGPFLRQPVKAQFSLNGEESHERVSKNFTKEFKEAAVRRPELG